MIEQAAKEVMVKEIKEIKEIAKAAMEKRQSLHAHFDSKVKPIDGCFEKSNIKFDDKGRCF